MTELSEPPVGGEGGGGGGGTTYGQPLDRERLRGFVLDLRAFMDRVIAAGLLPGDPEAYTVALGELTSKFDLVVAQLGLEGIDDHLRVAGLVGRALDLKIDNWDAGLQAFETIEQSDRGGADRGSLGDALRGLRRRAARVVFRAADVILGSLSALPGVEPILEFKEVLEGGLDVVELNEAIAAEMTRAEDMSQHRKGRHFDL